MFARRRNTRIKKYKDFQFFMIGAKGFKKREMGQNIWKKIAKNLDCMFLSCHVLISERLHAL